MLKSGQGKLLLRFVASIKCSWRVESTSKNIYLGITLFFQPEKILTLWRDKSNHYEESISRSLVLRNSPRKELYDKKNIWILYNRRNCAPESLLSALGRWRLTASGWPMMILSPDAVSKQSLQRSKILRCQNPYAWSPNPLSKDGLHGRQVIGVVHWISIPP